MCTSIFFSRPLLPTSFVLSFYRRSLVECPSTNFEKAFETNVVELSVLACKAISFSKSNKQQQKSVLSLRQLPVLTAGNTPLFHTVHHDLTSPGILQVQGPCSSTEAKPDAIFHRLDSDDSWFRFASTSPREPSLLKSIHSHQKGAIALILPRKPATARFRVETLRGVRFRLASRQPGGSRLPPPNPGSLPGCFRCCPQYFTEIFLRPPLFSDKDSVFS